MDENSNQLDINLFGETSTIVTTLINWLNRNSIGSSKEKRKCIARDIFWVVCDNNMTLDDIINIENYIKTHSFELIEGNLRETLLNYFGNSKFVEFMLKISQLIPTGLDTSPNAKCGKFELMMRLLRPNSRQPSKGDFMEDGDIHEIKGNQVRISSLKLTGYQYDNMTTSIFNGHFRPNIVKSGDKKDKHVFEIEKKQYEEHYKLEFAKNPQLAKSLVSQLLDNLEITQYDIDDIFRDNVWDREKYVWTLVKDFFKKYKEDGGFRDIFFFGDGSNVKIITTSDDLVSKCELGSDFFRISQPVKIGWYIK